MGCVLRPGSATAALWTRFDLGGFGIGSDFTWQANVNAVYSFNEKTAIIFGYRIIDLDYDDDDAAGEFELDAATRGPIAGLFFQLLIANFRSKLTKESKR